MPRGSLCSKLNEHRAGRLIKESCSKQIIHILIFVSRSWCRARERAGLELANGAEEKENMGGGLKQLLGRKRLIPETLGREQCNAGSRGGMECCQEEKAESRGYQKTGMDFWEE